MLRSAAFIKCMHAVLFILINGALAVLLYQVIFDRITILAWIAAALFLIEGTVLVVNRWKCPLTEYAERLGSTHGRVTDLFLPKWFADRAFLIYGVLWSAGLALFVIRVIR